jgi:hypothetical protein
MAILINLPKSLVPVEVHHVLISGGIGELEAYVTAHTDMAGEFTAYACDTMEAYRVHGWNVEIEDLEGEEA